MNTTPLESTRSATLLHLGHARPTRRRGRIAAVIVGLSLSALTLCGCASGQTTTTTDPSPTPAPSTSGPQLTIRLAGTGVGTVVANPTGPSYKTGDTVVLTAVPGTASLFTGWTAPCPTTQPAPSTCTLTLTANTTVFAQFDLD